MEFASWSSHVGVLMIMSIDQCKGAELLLTPEKHGQGDTSLEDNPNNMLSWSDEEIYRGEMKDVVLYLEELDNG